MKKILPIIIVVAAFALLAFYFVSTSGALTKIEKFFAPANIQDNNNNQNNNVNLGTNNVAPSVGLVFTDQITGLSITASAVSYKDAVTNQLLGSSPTFVNGWKVIALVNSSAYGYIPEVQPEYDVTNGPQALKGNLYKFANVSITIGKNQASGTSIGGQNGSIANDTAFTTQSNNLVTFTGNAFKSSGKQFIVWQISNTTSVNNAQLIATVNGQSTTLTQIPVPNCYQNVVETSAGATVNGGTPFRMAWELPAIIDGAIVTYNLQTLANNGLTVSGMWQFTAYSEKDWYDSIHGNFLTSGICDSGNTFYNMDKQTYSGYFN